MTEACQRVLRFGPFRFLPARGELHDGERAIQVGRRALDLLLALIEQRGQVVTKRALFEAAWPGMFVDEANLRVQIGLLRRALGEHAGRYILNVTGRGYSFVGDVADERADIVAAPATGDGVAAFPRPLTRLVGRDGMIASLVGKLERQRVVTVVGSGGIGKTSIAIATAHALAAARGDELCFVDLGGITDAKQVPTALAAALSIPVHALDVTHFLCQALESRRLLIVLDNCEHVISAAATLAEQLAGRTRHVTILATSREPLRIQGEVAVRLLPLPVPAAERRMTAAEALFYPAIQLFIERAVTGSDEFRFADEDVATVAEICRKLDGIPLALEMAAARTGTLGIKALAGGLDQRFLLLTRGLRTALPRHKTLRATLEWSHALLTEDEKILLRRLALFQSEFTLEDAYAVANFDRTPLAYFQDLLAELVSKSMVSISLIGDTVVYRLLETTRAFGLEQLRAAGEQRAGSLRHATHFAHALDTSAAADWDVAPTGDAAALFKRSLDDVRQGLAWAFSDDGDLEVASALAAASAPLWLQMSLFAEYRRWLELAFERCAAVLEQQPDQEMRLRAALGMIVFNMDGPHPEAYFNDLRCLALADTRRSTPFQLRAIWALCGLANVSGEFQRAVDYAERYGQLVAIRPSDDRARLIHHRMTALSLHQIGDQSGARRHAEQSLASPPPPREQRRITYQYDHWVTARSTLARIAWIQGQPDLALEQADCAIEEALAIDHKASALHALAISACPIALWSGDLAAARRYAGLLKDTAERYGFSFWLGWALVYEELLPFMTPDARRAGVILKLQQPTAPIHAMTVSTIHQSFLCPKLIRSALTKDSWFAPEVQRAEAERALGLEGEAAFDRAEALLRRSAALAARQGALAWELRTATSLARLLARRGRPDEAAEQLRPVRARFAEGFATADLIDADAVLDGL